MAAWVGSPEFVEVLLSRGARRDSFVDAALGDVERVRDALPALAGARDPQGLTALQCAAAARMGGARTEEVARLLIAHGADISLKVRS